MAAKSKRARKVRAAAEFDVTRLRLDLDAPRVSPSAYSWALSDIATARDQQMAGRFKLPARLAESMRTDDALYVAFTNRLAALRSVAVGLVPARGARGVPVAAEADALFGRGGVGISADTERDIHGALVNHGVAFAVNVATPREDGSRVDFAVKSWPIEFVRWNAVDMRFETQTADGLIEPIVHGDGRWIVVQDGELSPFKNGALLPAAMVWARHAFALRDWAKGSIAHGSAKVIGKMAPGTAIRTADGLTPEATAFVDTLKAIAAGDSPVGVIPAGSSLDFLTNNSSAWQVWSELVLNAEKAAARVYLGTDGVLGAAGGAPGVDISALFGVATTKLQGDKAAIERALQTGTIEPWAAINFGDSSLAPKRCYKLPDADADALKKSLADRTTAFSAALKGRKEAGLALTQEDVDGLAADFGVRAPKVPAPRLDPAAASAAAE